MAGSFVPIVGFLQQLCQPTEMQAVFVYGTLKRGQCREHCWPLPPESVAPAWTLGQLFDLGPYPAMIAGGQRIGGQLWSYRAADMECVRRALDQIEVTNQPGIPNEYDRSIVQVHLLDGRSLSAETYLFSNANQLPKLARPVEPTRSYDGHQYAVWPTDVGWPRG